MTKIDITLTQERLKELVHYDPETGVFTSIVNRGKCRLGNIIGSIDTGGYIECNIFYRKYRLHQLAFIYMTGSPPKHQVDHINHDRADNRWKNLADTPQTQNMKNSSMHSTNSSGIMGVATNKNTGKWDARVWVNGRTVHIYYGDDFFEACCARKSAEVELGYHRNHGR